MKVNSDISHVLRVFPCLSYLTEEELSTIGLLAREKAVFRNDILFREKDPVEFFFIVRTGAVKLYKTSVEGRELNVKIIRQGDYSCCAPLFAGGRNLVRAKAIEDSVLVIIPSANFKEMLCHGLDDMGLRVIGGLCSRIKYLSNLVEDIAFKDVEQRVLTGLLRLAEERAPQENIVYLSVSHQEIASMTGTVREVVSRTMSKLKRDGIIVDSTIRGFKLNKEKLL